MNKRIIGLVVVFALASTATIAFALMWNGVDWNAPYGSIAVVGGNLQVTTAYDSPTSSWGTAHYNTPSSFRAAATPWVQFTFIDAPGTAGGQLWMEDEEYVTPGAGAWTQFGSWERGDRPNYMIYWWDYDTDLGDNGLLDDSSGWALQDTGIARTAGSHTLLLGKRIDGTIDYWLDGSLVFSTTNITPNYFGDIYLAAHSPGANPGQTIVFTDYQTGIDYSYTPPPVGGEWVPINTLQMLVQIIGSAAAMSAVAASFVGYKRIKKKQN